ncbi:MAG: hypothetical protein IKT37_08935 [Clostridia bacterium]|nr:hypothetical protein [Clostridia bacterium]
MKKFLITVLALLTLFCFVACDSKDEYSSYALKTFEESKDFYKKICSNVPYWSTDDDYQLKLLNSSTLNCITFNKDGPNFDEELGILVYKSESVPDLPVYILKFEYKNEEDSGVFLTVDVPHNNPYLQELLLKTGYENNLADFILTAEDMKDFTADDYTLMHNLMDSIYKYMYEEYTYVYEKYSH